MLVRHGVTDWNAERRYLGRTDEPLNGQGRLEASELGRKLALLRFQAIYSSPLQRTAETAELILQEMQAAAKGLSPLHAIAYDARLRETDFGRIEGLTYEEALRVCPEELIAWYDRFETIPPPGGTESLKQISERMNLFMADIGKRHNGPVLIVSHGGPIRAWLARALHKPFWDIAVGHGQTYELELAKQLFS
nr:histidine phosphatase family protein [Paenibacillus hamazuiensis]